MKQTILYSIIFILLGSCNQDFKELKKRKKELDLRLTAYKFQLNHRADAIAQIGTLNEELKEKYRYDSLVSIQKEQIEEFKKMDAELKSIQNALEKMKE